jgi:alkylation response protein AidB-like acyl-CoA dehydrogenase
MAASLEIEHGSSLAKVQRQMLRAGVELCRRTQRGGRPLIEADDTIRRLARTATHIEVATVIYHRALWTSYEKRVNLGYGSASKVFSSEKFVADAADLLDLSAPESLALDDPAAAFLNQCFRHSQGTTIYGGTSEVHRSMVAERRLGLPRSRS